ncbi:hypothetical protein J5N97_024348 [Dioscorea zingiberensis]|uniref:Uncharacterized protein n=1 Tax=Dioscorea zingiberensis TaxID=325984 RepID=A0A9D5C6J5_9LILI|nr:hypothetical protein J5N97_024348 [Dioscorea zingiberensis]
MVALIARNGGARGGGEPLGTYPLLLTSSLPSSTRSSALTVTLSLTLKPASTLPGLLRTYDAASAISTATSLPSNSALEEDSSGALEKSEKDKAYIAKGIKGPSGINTVVRPWKNLDAAWYPISSFLAVREQLNLATRQRMVSLNNRAWFGNPPPVTPSQLVTMDGNRVDRASIFPVAVDSVDIILYNR